MRGLVFLLVYRNCLTIVSTINPQLLSNCLAITYIIRFFHYLVLGDIMSRQTTITVNEDIKEYLEKLKGGSKSWNSFLLELVNSDDDDDEKIIVIPETVDINDILESIDQVKPPTKYRALIFWFIMAMLGGWGLGIWLLK